MADDIKIIWKNADAVCFDVDSTVITTEAIDALAKFCGKNEIKVITEDAMTGKLDFRTSLSKRLQIISPSLSQMQNFIQTHPFKLTKNVRQLIDKLHQKQIPVYLISGGFRGVIGPIALDLSIPLQNIYANKLKFYLDGKYAGFDENEPTSKNGGKAIVINELKHKYGYNKVVMIGDGMTDAEACPPADAFIGFGGNIVRDEVKAKSNWYVMDFQELLDEL